MRTNLRVLSAACKTASLFHHWGIDGRDGTSSPCRWASGTQTTRPSVGPYLTVCFGRRLLHQHPLRATHNHQPATATGPGQASQFRCHVARSSPVPDQLKQVTRLRSSTWCHSRTNGPRPRRRSSASRRPFGPAAHVAQKTDHQYAMDAGADDDQAIDPPMGPRERRIRRSAEQRPAGAFGEGE